MGSIRVGCSGWSFEDWIGPFYPDDIEQDALVDHYFSKFKLLEIGSTFFKRPSKKEILNLARSCSKYDDRELTVKVPMRISHELAMEGSPERMDMELKEFSREVLDVIDDHGVLGAVLFQTSPYFTVRGDIKYRMKSEPKAPLPKYVMGVKRLDEICSCLNDVPGDSAVEIRNSAWLNEDLRLRKDAVDILMGQGAALTTLDSPSFPWFSEDTARHNYVRFLGRNKQGWFRSSDSDPDERFDYHYNEDELRSRKDEILIMDSKVGSKTRVVFNNYPGASAPENALEISDILTSDE